MEQSEYRRALQETALKAVELVSHIRKYWSIDGLPPAELSAGPTLANANVARHLSGLMNELNSGRAGFYPGAGFEWMLRIIVADCHRLELATSRFSKPWIKQHPEAARNFLAPLPSEPEDIAAVTLWDVLHPLVYLANQPLDANTTFSSTALNDTEAKAWNLIESLEFVPSELQTLILQELEGNSRTRDQLCIALGEIATETLYGKKDKKSGKSRGGLNELTAFGLVANDRRIGGYYRPDAPPK